MCSYRKKYLLGFLLLFTGSVCFSQTGVSNSDRIIEQKVDSLLKLLSLKEKVDMCHAQSRFSVKGNPRLGIPELWMADGPHGVRMEIDWDSWNHSGWTNDSSTAFPALTCLAATFNTELSFKYGKALGAEARYRKKDIILGPGVNIFRTPLNGRNFEYFGEDPFLASRMVVPYIQGVQLNGVAACLKHFALNNQEHLRKKINVEASDRALNEIYFPAFKAGVEEGKVWSIMGAYNRFRGEMCCQHAYLINDVLKGQWKFDGVVITDWGTLNSTRTAALSGLDIEMGTRTDGLTKGEFAAYNDYYLANPFINAITNGDIDVKVLDEKVRRILRLHLRTTMNTQKPFGSFATQEHFNLSEKIAEEGIVLLKNEDKLFPIKNGAYKKILVVGENAVRNQTAGGGSSELKPWIEVTPLKGITDKFKASEVLFATGYTSDGYIDNQQRFLKKNDSLYNDAVLKAKDADLVIFIGGLNKTYQQDSEGQDRVSYDLPYNQNRLIEGLLNANKNTGIVIISGNGYSMPWISKARSLFQSWYLGSVSGTALANILSGDVNPSGKLPFTITASLNDIGAHSLGEASYPGINNTVEYKDDIFVGYRWVDKKKIKPQFEFGYGMSYTNFKIAAPEINKKEFGENDTLRIKVSIENTGSMAGAEVIQAYIGQKSPKLPRPEKELKGFAKAEIQPGSSKNVEISIPLKSMAYYDDVKQQWVLDKDTFYLYLGTSSRKIVKAIPFKVI